MTLPQIIDNLAEAYEHLGFLRSQELEHKARVWLDQPIDMSVQYRDRQAAYQAAHITSEILQLESHIQALNTRRLYLERLMDSPDGNPT